MSTAAAVRARNFLQDNLEQGDIKVIFPPVS
jgi:hypothetical protein